MSEKISSRTYDSSLEKSLQSNFNKAYHLCGMSFYRTKDKATQINAGDVVAVNNNKPYFIEEKCAAANYQKDLKTFSLELSFIPCDRKTNKPLEYRTSGWLIKDNIQTDIYSFGYVRAKSKENLQNNNLDRFEVIMVKRDILLKYIQEKIGDIDRIKKLECEFRKRAKEGKSEKYGAEDKTRYREIPAKGFRLCWSPYLAESPVNLLIDKKILEQLAFRHIVLTGKKYITEGFLD